MSALVGRAAHCACLAACALLIGCAGVAPLPTRTRGAGGEESREKVGTDFIRVGQTSRAEVAEKLGWVNAGVESDKFFLARWSKSNLGEFALLCGYVECVGGARRRWGMYNALVEFDDQGLVKRYTVFGDRSLAKELSPVAAQQKTVDFSEPREISVDHDWGTSILPATIVLSRPATIGLSLGIFEVRESGKKPQNFQIASTKVIRVGPLEGGGAYDVQHTEQVIYFSEKTKVGRKMTVRMTVPDLWLLLEFLAQNQAGGSGPN